MFCSLLEYKTVMHHSLTQPSQTISTALQKAPQPGNRDVARRGRKRKDFVL